uniref:RING-type domain-containing protein n=1 Tax=Panagrellus redivivus TaxID=6233 RepID=A0A7E4W3J2_PANRE
MNRAAFPCLTLDSPPHSTVSANRKRQRDQSPLRSYQCSICRNIYNNPHATPCGHVFCKVCIETAIREVRYCPICKKVLSRESKLTHRPDKEETADMSRLSFELAYFLKTRGYDLSSPRIDTSDGTEVIESIVTHFRRVYPQFKDCQKIKSDLMELQKKRRDKQKKEERKLAIEFFEIFKTRRQEMAYKRYNEARCAIDDLNTLKETIFYEPPMPIENRSTQPQLTEFHVVPEVQNFINQPIPNQEQGGNILDPPDFSMPKDPRLALHLDDLEREYILLRSRRHKSSVCNCGVTSYKCEETVNHFTSLVRGITRYSKFSNIATMDYTRDSYPTSSVVSAIDFDKDSEYFVIAGIGHKIKIYDYDTVIERPSNPNPIAVMHTPAKVSNVSWNPHAKAILASSNYSGSVQVWDTSMEKCLHTFKEHEKRCWSVQFNHKDPNVMASGSDDMRVKLWNLTCGDSIATIDTKVQVCCVHFNPTKQNQLVFGGSDHSIYVFDMRFLSTAQSILKGHKKAVSYVKYMDADHIVSASTDSTCKVWNINTGECERTMEGHMNEKNFVGLATTGDHIVCGSETNEVYAYYRHMSKPICKYDFSPEPYEDFTGLTIPRPQTDGQSDFVSALCWKRDSNIVIAANSQGRAYVLQLNE